MTTPPPFLKGDYAAGGFLPPTTPGVIPTPVTTWAPLPVVLTEPRLTWGRVLARIVANYSLTFAYAWVLMLIIGALHHMALPWLPPLGYWPTLLLMLALRIVQTVAPLWTLTETRSQTTQDMVKTLGGRR